MCVYRYSRTRLVRTRDNTYFAFVRIHLTEKNSNNIIEIPIYVISTRLVR